MNIARHPWIIPVLILIVILLFGSRRLPDMARSVGQSLKIFKKEVKDLREDDQEPGVQDAPSSQATDATGRDTRPAPTSAPEDGSPKA